MSEKEFLLSVTNRQDDHVTDLFSQECLQDYYTLKERRNITAFACAVLILFAATFFTIAMVAVILYY